MKVIAAGNPFYGDDGVGAAVLDAIRTDGVLPGAELVDIHTDALALLEHLEQGAVNVVVDAAHMGLEPGDVAAFGVDEVRMRIRKDHLSVHGFGLAEAFDIARQLGKLPPRTLIVGVEPQRIEINQGLSPAVAAAVPRVISIIKAEVQSDD
ncbi:MAG: hydrogenase maturation protease [bacterium]